MKPAAVYPAEHGKEWKCPVCGASWMASVVVPGFRCEHPAWKPRRSERPRDSQRSAVYAWERALDDAYPHLREPMTFDECRAKVAEVWEDYHPGSRPPEVKDGRGRRSAGGSRWAVKLPVWSRHLSTVLHEVSHAITHDERPAHGRVFARTMLDLLARYGRVPVGEALRLARTQKPRRVWFAKVAACAKPAGREHRAWAKERERLARIAREAADALRAHDLRRPKP